MTRDRMQQEIANDRMEALRLKKMQRQRTRQEYI